MLTKKRKKKKTLTTSKFHSQFFLFKSLQKKKKKFLHETKDSESLNNNIHILFVKLALSHLPYCTNGEKNERL